MGDMIRGMRRMIKYDLNGSIRRPLLHNSCSGHRSDPLMAWAKLDVVVHYVQQDVLGVSRAVPERG